MLKRKHRDDVIGASIYPSPTAGDGHLSVDKYTGITDFYRCQQCGFGILPMHGIVSPGAANQGDGGITNDSVSGDPTGGRPFCPFCGSANSRS